MAVDDSKPVDNDDGSSAKAPPDVEAEVVSMGENAARVHDAAGGDPDAVIDLGGEPPLGDLNDDTEHATSAHPSSALTKFLTPMNIGGVLAFLALVASASWFLSRNDGRSAEAIEEPSATAAPETSTTMGSDNSSTQLVLPSRNETETELSRLGEKASNPDTMRSAKEALQNLPRAEKDGPGLPSLDSVDASAIDNIGLLESAKDALNTLEMQTPPEEGGAPDNDQQSAAETEAITDDPFWQNGMRDEEIAQPAPAEADVTPQSAVPQDANADAPLEVPAGAPEEKVDAANEAPAEGADANAPIETSAIDTENNLLQNAVDEAVRAANEEIALLQNALQAANRRITSLEADLAQARLSFQAETQAPENAANDEIASLRSRLADAEARARRLPAEGAMLSMMNALASGAPFADPLQASGSIIQSDAAPIAAYAMTGVPTIGELERAFDPAARKAVAADIRARAKGPIARFVASLASLIVVRPAEPRAGSTIGAQLARAEAALERNDIRGALEEVSTIEGAARAAMEPWIKDAEARLAADMIAERLASIDATFHN